MSATAPPGAADSHTRRGKKEQPVQGFPAVSYPTPLFATLATTVGLLLVLVLVGLITGAGSYSQITRASAGDPEASSVLGGLCGALSLASLVGSVFLTVVTYRTIRDLRTPMQYARGTVKDKRTIGGRNVGNWLGVDVRYVGSDLEQASALTDSQRAAAPDRTSAVHPRFEAPLKRPEPPPPLPPRTAYLPAERIYASRIESPPNADKNKAAEDAKSRIVFRVDPSSFVVLEPGEEVLVAFSRYLQHIYFVSHLRGGDWESFRNRQIL